MDSARYSLPQALVFAVLLGSLEQHGQSGAALSSVHVTAGRKTCFHFHALGNGASTSDAGTVGRAQA